MPLPKYEDWTPPWKVDDDFDAEKAKRLIYNLHVDKEGLQTRLSETTTARDEATSKLAEHETKDLSELERVQRELAEMKAAPPKVDDTALARYEIALDKGLTRAQAKRLVGTSREELTADADAYIEEHGLNTDREPEGTRPPTRRPQTRLSTGLAAGDEDEGSNDPAKLAGLLPPRR